MIGTRLSHYDIEAELGRGGMGIVYRARDTKLGRTVAIKVLPPSALASQDDRARFFREAQAAAQLTHPNIATIYEIDEAVSEGGSSEEPRPFIAMEFIEGATLEDRIKEGPLKLDEVIALASQVAGALGAAHDKNIVHRDIKSANIMLTADGQAKVLDFGLALTAQSTKLTRMGSTLGTVAYMSPEQARGEEVDNRTDLWALGVVIYEMIVGSNPFGGDYEQAVVYSILNEDPEPVTALRTGIPMELEQLIDKCLRKEAGHRYQSAADLKADLAALSLPSRGSRTTRIATPSTASLPPPGSPAQGSPGANSRTAKTAMILLGLVIGVAGTWTVLRGATDNDNTNSEVVRSSIVLPADAALTFSSRDVVGLEMSGLDVSRDGRWMVYRKQDGEELPRLVLRDLQTGAQVELAGTEGAYFPVFSPDASWIAYFIQSAVYRVPREGGSPRFVGGTSDPTGLLWHDDGYLYWAERQGTFLVRSLPDGEAEMLNSEARCNCGLPTVGPDGTGVVVSGRDTEEAWWWHAGQMPVEMDIPGNHVRYLSNGSVVFTRTGSLMAARYDPATGRIQGDEVLMLDDIRTGSILRSGHYDVTDNGTLFYVAGAPSGQVNVIVRDGNGQEANLGLPTGVYGPVNVSPDGRYIIIQRLDQGRQYELLDRQTGGSQTILRDDQTTGIVWGADAQIIHYTAVRGNETVFMERNLRTNAESELFRIEGDARLSAAAPDGKFLAYSVYEATFQRMFIRNIEDGSVEQVNREEEVTYWAADWSRDGRFFSYTRVGEGGSKIFVEPFPRDGTFRALSPGWGEEAEMLFDEDALIYRDGSSWYKVRFGDTLDSFAEPELAFSGPYVNVAGMEFRVLPGGEVVLQRAVNTDSRTGRIEVISGFDRLVEQRLGQRGRTD